MYSCAWCRCIIGSWNCSLLPPRGRYSCAVHYSHTHYRQTHTHQHLKHNTMCLYELISSLASPAMLRTLKHTMLRRSSGPATSISTLLSRAKYHSPIPFYDGRRPKQPHTTHKHTLAFPTDTEWAKWKQQRLHNFERRPRKSRQRDFTWSANNKISMETIGVQRARVK